MRRQVENALSARDHGRTVRSGEPCTGGLARWVVERGPYSSHMPEVATETTTSITSTDLCATEAERLFLLHMGEGGERSQGAGARCRASVARLCAGYPCRRGTILFFRQRLAALPNAPAFNPHKANAPPSFPGEARTFAEHNDHAGKIEQTAPPHNPIQ